MAFDSGGFNLEMRTFEMEVERRSSEEHHHFPYARKLKLGWRRTQEGWTSDSEDPHLWEVFCAECGDTDGPADQQSPEVQELRGPYKHHHQAKHAATKHFEEH